MPLFFKTKKCKGSKVKIIRVEKRPQLNCFGIAEIHICFKNKRLSFDNLFIFIVE